VPELRSTFWVVPVAIALCLIALGFGAATAYAQEDSKSVPNFMVRPDIGNLQTPDWSLPDTAQGAGAGKKATFYERCMLNAHDNLPPIDQRALCACMDAHKESISRDPKDEYWTNTIRTRHVTPYETFVTRIFAPCMYLEAFTLGARECYRQKNFTVLFPTPQAFDDYCTCYARATEVYVRKYAEPLITAKMAGLTPNERKDEPDPAGLLMNDIDYSIYIDRERRRCTAIYGYHTNE
jgi:hypothetical protein